MLKFALVCLSCLLALIIAELGLRLFWHPQLTTWQRNINTTMEIDPSIIAGVAGPSHIVTNSMGIRGDEWSHDRSKEYRILAIGGSTTECLLNDQQNTWPALLQRKLGILDGRKVWVGNVGHSGFDSRHHVLEMKYMMDQYNPDAVVILMGGNDQGLLLSEGMSYDPHFVEDQKKMRNLAMQDFIERPVEVMRHADAVRLKTLRDSRLAMILRESKNRLLAMNRRGFVHNVEMYRQLRQKRHDAWLVVHDLPSDMQLGLSGYSHNIREIIRLANQHHVRLIFMTQPTLFQPNMSQKMVDKLWAGWVGDPVLSIYWSPEVAYAVTNAHNSLLLEICREEGIACIDLAAKLPKSLDVLFDQCHFTDYGCSLVADALVGHFHNPPGASRSTP